MKSFLLKFKPFDLFILIIGLTACIFFVIKGIANKAEVYGFYAFVTFLFTILHGKLASINKNP